MIPYQKVDEELMDCFDKNTYYCLLKAYTAVSALLLVTGKHTPN
jgi:hypothetical protein